MAIIIDVVWLIYYTERWWNTGYDDSYSQLHLRRAMIVLSYLLMLVRVLVIIALSLSYKDLPIGDDEFVPE